MTSQSLKIYALNIDENGELIKLGNFEWKSLYFIDLTYFLYYKLLTFHTEKRIKKLDIPRIITQNYQS